jgi:putative ABC transport system permease protein
MFKNYFIVAVRNFWRNKVFSLINIIGLSIGISAALVIYLIVYYDFSFDKFHKDGDRIYRVVSNFIFSGDSFKNSGIPVPLAKAVKDEASGLDIVSFFSTQYSGGKVSVPDEKNGKPVMFKNQDHIIFADENYFKLIEYEWIAGSPKISLQQPYQVVLTESNAKLFFPKLSSSQIIGKELDFNDTVHTTVAGIVKDLGQNTDFSFKTFISKATFETPRIIASTGLDQWGSTSSSSQLLIKLSAGTSTKQIEDQVKNIFKKYKKKDPADNSTTVFSLQPLNDLHFNTDYDNFNGRVAHKPTLYGLLAVAVFLLLLGCINFINLTTAQASQRAKEIGIRKTMGSSKKQLVSQFLSETFFITFIATILSIGLVPLLLKVFSNFIPPGLHFNLLQQPHLILFLFILIIVVTLLSGFYPSVVLSQYNPAVVLKGQINSGKNRKIWLRQTLTVSQFIIAQVFIMATLVVSKQIHFTLNKDLGFKKEAIVFLNTNYYDTVANHRRVLIDRLKAIPGIALVSLSNTPPASGNTWSSTMKYKDGKKEIETDVQLKMADTNYVNIYKLKLLAGKNIPYSDTANNLMINATYARILGFKEPALAIGKYVEWDKKQMPIVGVVSDFHQKSLHETIKPLAIASNYSQERTINIALQAQNKEGNAWKATIAGIGKVWKEIYPEDDFEYTFLDEDIGKFYKSEQDISSLLKWATGLAILISCLGLLGLVIYTTNQRTKEIGVRKVLGASVSQIVSILSKDFVVLVLIAFAIAAPVAWWATSKWLENFAYKTSVSWWIFALSGILMVIVALLTLSIQTIKAANANPVKSLRTE